MSSQKRFRYIAGVLALVGVAAEFVCFPAQSHLGDLNPFRLAANLAKPETRALVGRRLRHKLFDHDPSSTVVFDCSNLRSSQVLLVSQWSSRSCADTPSAHIEVAYKIKGFRARYSPSLESQIEAIMDSKSGVEGLREVNSLLNSLGFVLYRERSNIRPPDDQKVFLADRLSPAWLGLFSSLEYVDLNGLMLEEPKIRRIEVQIAKALSRHFARADIIEGGIRFRSVDPSAIASRHLDVTPTGSSYSSNIIAQALR